MPDNKFKVYWNLMLIVLLLYVMVWVPVEVCFMNSDEATWLNLGVDLFFSIDMVINFISAYEAEENQ